MSTAITFDQMERRADKTLAVVLWTKHATNVLSCAFYTEIANIALGSLLRAFTPEKLESLSSEEAIDLTRKLQSIHSQLVTVSKLGSMCQVSQVPILRGSIKRLEEKADDLSDIIEDLVLSENKDFRSLVANCAESVSPKTLVRM